MFSGNVTLRPSSLSLWRALLLGNAGASHPIQSRNEENGTYPSYISKQQGGEPSEEAQGILSISQQDRHSITPLSLTTILCAGPRLLGTPLKIGGTSKDPQDQTTGLTYSKTKYRYDEE